MDGEWGAAAGGAGSSSGQHGLFDDDERPCAAGSSYEDGSPEADAEAVAAAVGSAAAAGAERPRSTGEVLVDSFRAMLERIRWAGSSAGLRLCGADARVGAFGPGKRAQLGTVALLHHATTHSST